MNKQHQRLIFSAAGLFLLLIVVVTTSCNKKLSSYNPDFVGKWRTLAVYDSTLEVTLQSEIVIEKKDGLYNGNCRDVCSEHLCDCLAQHSGTAMISTDKTQLKFGSSGSYPLTIDKEPYQNSAGEWMMIIDGLTYYKQP